MFKILPVTAHDTYLETPRDARAVVRRAYWVDADPDPTTLVNERELEHVYRVFVADLLFSNDWTGRRGWTSDRGSTFIKFGRPMDIEHTLGGGQDGQVEKWSYLRDGQYSDFLFVDEFLNGDPRIPYGDDFTLHFMLHAAESSEIESDVARIPATIDVSVFRDDELRASFYAGMRVDADSMANYALPGSTNRYLIRGVYFDHEWKREAADGDTLWTSQLPARETPGARVIEFVRGMSLPFDFYRVAWSIEDDHKRVRALARGHADARRFATDKLTLSDVLLFEEVPDGAPAMTGVIERGGLRMRPRIGHAYAPGDPLRAYAEVYGLTAYSGDAEFEIRYTIYPGTKADEPAWKDWIRGAADVLGFGEEEPVIAQSFTRRITGHTASEHITIDISALKPGIYDLVVDVLDLNAGAQITGHTSLTMEAGPVAKRTR
jgi:GWxTD domain-containing protein